MNELIGNYMQKFAEMYVGRISWLRQFVGHVDTSTREIIGRFSGIVISELSVLIVVALLEDLITTFDPAQNTRFEEAQLVNDVISSKDSKSVQKAILCRGISAMVALKRYFWKQR